MKSKAPWEVFKVGDIIKPKDSVTEYYFVKLMEIIEVVEGYKVKVLQHTDDYRGKQFTIIEEQEVEDMELASEYLAKQQFDKELEELLK